MDNCQVCGTQINSTNFGIYCSSTCRDSETALLGKNLICECCGNEFKSIKKRAVCINCQKEALRSQIKKEFADKKAVSSFKYSIFEDNIDRIIQGASAGDKRNCLHASNKILEDFDSSLLPKFSELLESSNSKAKVWFIDLLLKVNDQSAIYLLEKCLTQKESDEVKKKAIEAINKLQKAY